MSVVGVVGIVIFSISLAWLIIYRVFKERLEAACDRIKSPGRRKTVKVILNITYVLSVIIVIFQFVIQIVNLFSKKK